MGKADEKICEDLWRRTSLYIEAGKAMRADAFSRSVLRRR